jgi:paraquat-inducible protein A
VEVDILMQKRLLPVLLLAAATTFGLGVCLPLIQLKKLWYFSETPSLIGVISGLFTNGDYGLALLVGAVSIVFPLVAILVFAAKTSGLATAVTQPGVWFYAASTIATAFAASMVHAKR